MVSRRPQGDDDDTIAAVIQAARDNAESVTTRPRGRPSRLRPLFPAKAFSIIAAASLRPSPAERVAILA